MQSYGDPPPEIVDEMSGGLGGLLGGGGGGGGGGANGAVPGSMPGLDEEMDADDIGNFQLPPEMMGENLPKELQDCKMQ